MSTSNKASFALYHPNGKGTGCAIKMEVVPAFGIVPGYVSVRFARQKTVGDCRGDNPRFPTFDTDNEIEIALGLADICKMLQVLRGDCESIEEGKGLYHRNNDNSVAQRIIFRHLLEPVTGYSWEVYESRKEMGADGDSQAHILMTTYEALGIAIFFENILGAVCFGNVLAPKNEEM